nr:hypothetical protein [Tanacetum cinerariifolium]
MPSMLNVNSKSVYAIYNECLFDANHDKCVLDYVHDVNVLSKYKHIKRKNKMRKLWKPMGKLFIEIRYRWKPTRRIFTIVRNRYPLTRITSTKEVPLKETIITPVITSYLELKVVQIVLWYLDSECSKHMTGALNSSTSGVTTQQTIPQNSAFQTEDLDSYDSDCDDISSAKAVMMENLSSYDSDVLFETNKMVNESLTAQLERYKERVTIIDQRLNVDLNKRKTLIDSQMDELIRNRNAKFVAFQQEIDTLKQTISNIVITKKHDVISVIDDEETLILEEESRSKMLDKQNDPILIKHKIKISSIDYSNLKNLKEDFSKCFVTQQELYAEQAFRLKHLNFISKTLIKSHTPVIIEALSELPKDNSRENQNAPIFNQLFEINELKAQSQEQDTVIRKLKDKIKSLNGKDSVENVKKGIEEIETISIELEHSVAKLLSENKNLRKRGEHLKSIYKDQFDSIKKARVQSKEHGDSLIAQMNAKSVENLDLNAQL